MASNKFHSVLRSDAFKDQVIFVTGGGTGIGRACAHELASLGATVVIAGRNVESLKTVVNEITQLGGKADYRQMNIRNEAEVNKAVDDIVKAHGKINGLVNNAGGQFPSPVANMSSNGWKTVIDLNINGTFYVTKAVFRAWMEEHGGSIVNIIADMFNGFPMMAHTGAARAAVQNLTMSLGVEWGKYGIRINAVAPGIILSSGMKNYPDSLIEGVVRNANGVPAGRYGTESEVSSAVAFLLSDGAAYITGATLRVDGGSSLLKRSELAATILPEESKMPAYNGFPSHLKPDIPVKLQKLFNDMTRAKL
eukprot:TRINITY_DN5225_c0_g1_i1.p1 TRINITY_DN5225_c0_g1~~TRINITY_DN5225_c0_g1_i1.p1  ORF type:complete len:308 (-),score=58.11 TRINITY_DN5225_c0_g1_i1:1-924(-)